MVLTSLRTVVGAVMSSLLVIALALFFVLAPLDADPGDPGPPPLVLGGLVAGAVVLHLLIEAVGYRTSAAGAQADPVAAFRTGTMLRLALAESLAVVGVAAAFVVEGGGFVVYLVAAALSLALLGVHAFPWRRPIVKTEKALRRADLPHDLHTPLGLTPRRTGAIQEL